jgi:butyrate kinase
LRVCTGKHSGKLTGYTERQHRINQKRWRTEMQNNPKAQEKEYKLLIINPGSTSTKISLFINEKELFERSQFHDAPVLLQYPHVNDQVPFRYQVILDMLAREGVSPSEIDVFVGRGGSACTQPSGVTTIDQKLYDDTLAAVGGSEHAAKLGVLLAWKFSLAYHRPAYTLNPTNVDEYCDYARLTGIRGLYRVSHSHFLNHKAVAQADAEAMGKPYEDCNLITAHIDGGVTVGAHSGGRMIDGTMGADGEGPFAPTRIGSVPVLQLLDYIEAHSIDDVRRMCSRSGGFVSLFGTSNSDTIHAMVEQGDKKAALVWNTMIYQICKSIGEMSAVLCGKVDAIVLTGGLMRFDDITAGIRERCGWIAPIHVYPGELEQETMALSVLKVLRGQAAAMTYSGKNVWQGFEGITF